jgi:hypothetical protein
VGGNDVDGNDSDGDSSPDHPIHDVSYVPGYPTRSEDVGFSAGLPGGIQLSQLPDPRNVRDAMAAPDAVGWRDAMDQEMEAVS